LTILAVISMKGGVGKTSTTANLAAAIAQISGNNSVFALDLDPQNSLHLHFGIDTTEGVCRQSLKNAHWHEVAHPSQFGVTCLPYGIVHEPERQAFETLLEQHPSWVGEQLALAGYSDGVVLIDTPPGPTVYLRQTFACADIILIVVQADAASFLTIPAMESWLHEMAPMRPDLAQRIFYLPNQIDSNSPLRRDVMAILQQNLGQRLAPLGIHTDEAVGEALAFQQPVLQYDRYCQATHDFQHLANWLGTIP
jgi:cellulose synthase operon protein YhjQ